MSSELPARSATRVINLQASIVRQSGRGRLVIVNGPDRGASVLLADTPITFGSGSGSDFRLSDPTVSRRHLLAAPGEGGLLVRDLGSTNGSFVRGARFGELLLGFGGEIQIGQTHIKYVPEEEAVEVPPLETERFGSLVGRDPKMRQLFRLIGDIAGSDTTVLIEGETGTGKELFAEEIHRASPRRGGPFVVFDCGAVPRELIESALFGHVRGAFTGAEGGRAGAFEEASGGTLFLDEIGELPLEQQPALLRAIAEREVKPIGSDRYRSVDVRVVAATHRDLARAVSEGRFRADLYYRIAVLRVTVPPLRQRREDVPLLAREFIRQLRPDVPPEAVLTPGLLAAFGAYHWPGNVRELRNAIERLLVVGDPGELEPPRAREPEPERYPAARRQAIDRFERDYVAALLRESGGVIAQAASRAGISRQMFHRLVRRHVVPTDDDPAA